MLELFDNLLLPALNEWAELYDLCESDPQIAAVMCDTGTIDHLETWMCRIVNGARDAGLISLDDWREIRRQLTWIGRWLEQYSDNELDEMFGV